MEGFDRALAQIIDEAPASSLLHIPGIYEILAEHFNNDVLEKLREELLEETVNFKETYEIYTPDDLEHGDTENRGFINYNSFTPYGNMVVLLQSTTPSTFPLRDDEPHVWFQQIDPIVNYVTGEREYRSYHPVGDNDRRLMIKAWKETDERKKTR